MSFLRAKKAAAVTPDYTGLQIQTSSNALPIPILYGINRAAPNIIWNGGFATHPQFSQQSGGKGGGGGSTVTGYTYSTWIILAVSEGPITAIGTIYSGQGVYPYGAYYLSLIDGASPQTAWAPLTTSFPAAALTYPGTACMASTAYDLGSSASIGSIAFEVYGRLYDAPGAIAVNSYDIDPAVLILDFLTNAQYGVGFPPANIDATSLSGPSGSASYQAYCRAVGLALSPALVDQEGASSIVARWLQLTNAAAVWSGGRLKIVPYGDMSASGNGATFVPVTTPLYDLDDDDFVADDGEDPLKIARTDPFSLANVQRLECSDRANAYNLTTVEARDQNAIEQFGLNVGATITAHEICDLAIGRLSAQLILQRALYVRNSYTFRLSWEFCLLEPMDLVTLTDVGLGLARTPVRIIEIDEDDDGLLTVTAEDFLAGCASAPIYPHAGAQGTAINRNVAAGDVNPPLIFEPPAALTGGAAQIWIAASGGSSGVADTNWGGATVWISTDGTSFQAFGEISSPARQGVLTQTLSPGATSGLGVDLTESAGVLLGVAGAPPSTTLSLVGAELVSFDDALLTGVSTYTLNGLTRGLYGSNAMAHAVGEPFTMLDGAVLKLVLPADTIGVPLVFKFQSFNVFRGALEDLSLCAAYSYTPHGSGDLGALARALAAGTNVDCGLVHMTSAEDDDFGRTSDPYSSPIDLGLVSS
jgi:hypothetical protein